MFQFQFIFIINQSQTTLNKIMTPGLHFLHQSAVLTQMVQSLDIMFCHLVMYSKSSFTRTPVADLNSFLVRKKFFRKLQKSNISGHFREMFLFYHEHVCGMYSLESPHRGDFNKYTRHTIIL